MSLILKIWGSSPGAPKMDILKLPGNVYPPHPAQPRSCQNHIENASSPGNPMVVVGNLWNPLRVMKGDDVVILTKIRCVRIVWIQYSGWFLLVCTGDVWRSQEWQGKCRKCIFGYVWI